MFMGRTVAAIAGCAFFSALGWCATVRAGDADDPHVERERFEIIAYCTPPADQMSVERFREMAECGFTAGIPAERSHDLDTMEEMLDIAHRAGMKLFVYSRALLDDPEGTARRFRNHPAVAGYFVVDEPRWGPEGWSRPGRANMALGEIVDRIRAVDPDRPSYINLFPNYASPDQLGTATYREHVERFVEEVPAAEFISFDHYPIAHYRIRENWYENLEVISQVARERGLPFWAFALTSTHFDYTPATPEHLRLQMHVNLAYGAQVLQYFPYWAPNAAHWFSPIEYDGSRGFLFDVVRQLNADLQKLAPVFLGATVLDVGHTGTPRQWRSGSEANPEPWIQEEGPIPPGTRPYHPEPPIRSLAAQGQFGAVISMLEKEDRRFLAVVNKDYAHNMVLRIAFDGSRPIELMENDGSWRALDEQRFRTIVRPGDLVILGWEKP